MRGRCYPSDELAAFFALVGVANIRHKNATASDAMICILTGNAGAFIINAVLANRQTTPIHFKIFGNFLMNARINKTTQRRDTTSIPK